MAYRELNPDEWRSEIECGLDYRRRFGLEDMWGSMEAIYYNVQESMANDGPNIFLSQGDAMLSTLSVPAPRVSVKPLVPEAVDKAPLVESLDNAMVEDLQLDEEVESAVLNTYLFGRGIIKVGYDSEFGYDPSFDVGGALKLGLTLTQLNKKGTRRIEYDSGVSPGMPWIRSVMPHDIVVPWGVKDINTTPWIMHRIVRHIDDLRADVKYENVKHLEPQLSMEDFVNSYRNTVKPLRMPSSQKDAEYIEFYEIHDRRDGRIKAVTWDGSKFIRNQENSLQIDNQLPFAGLSFTPRTRAFWTTPDVYYLYYVQMELSDVAVQRTKQRRLAVLKFLYDKDSINDEELQKLLSPDVGAAAAIEAGRTINEAIIKVENSPNQSLIQEEELLRANAREQIGFSRNQQGEYAQGRKSATEASIVDKSSNLRMSRRGLKVKRLYEDTIRLMNNVIFTQWSLPRLVRVLGPTKADEWVRLSGTALKSKYSYKVDFVDESEVDQQKLSALQLYGMLAQDPGVDPIELRNFLIHRFNDPAFERIFNADVRNEVLQRRLLAATGGIQSQGPGNGAQGPPQMPQLQQQNGQANLQAPQGLLAR